MTSIKLVATAKAVKDGALKAALQDVAEGSTTAVDFTVRIVGTVTRAEGVERAPTCNLLSLAVLAKALAFAGVTADAWKVALRHAAHDALLAGEKVGEAVAEADERIAKVVREVQDEVVASLPKSRVAGAVKFNGTVVEIVDAAAAGEAVAATVADAVEVA